MPYACLQTPAYIESLVVQSKANAIIAAAVEEDKLKKKQKQEVSETASTAGCERTELCTN